MNTFLPSPNLGNPKDFNQSFTLYVLSRKRIFLNNYNMPPKYKCANCGSEFSRNDIGRCPNCKSLMTGIDDVPEIHGSTSSETMREPSTLDDLVVAQNRTTHAVRSLAITLVAAPIISLVVLTVLALAVKSGNTSIIVIAALMGLAALLGVLGASLTELRASRI